MNDPDAYWLWELEAAVRFVRGGGRKTSIDAVDVARQIQTTSSSRDAEDPAFRAPPTGPPPTRKKFAFSKKL